MPQREQSQGPLTYVEAGVDYAPLDLFKVLAQKAAAATSNNARGLGFLGQESSRGESAFMLDFDPHHGKLRSPRMDFKFAHVQEGLGTKNLVADAMMKHGDPTYYDAIAQDTLAMVVNDMITLGAFPVVSAMHLAVSSGDWFNHEQRTRDLTEGWRAACDMAACVWGGGETPALKDIIVPGAAELSGSAFGVVPDDVRMDQSRVAPGDQIIVLTSSGIHANGLTLARKIAEGLPEGYLTRVDGTNMNFGEALLQPTHIYVRALWACIQAGATIHYGVNVTGHGWRKLMRSSKELTYVISRMPPRQPIFDFLQKHGGVEEREMYSNFNMGAGFVLFVPSGSAGRVLEVVQAGDYAFDAMIAGFVAEGSRSVIIKPRDIVFEGESLQVR